MILSTLYLGRICHLLDDPMQPDALQAIDDGALLVVDGRVAEIGGRESLLQKLETAPGAFTVVDYRDGFILPGFVDAHLHFPQTDVIASHGTQLLEWLQKYTFPAEAQFHDPQHCRESADRFVHELLKNGTTCSMVYATVHPQSVDALFEKAASIDLRLACGKVMMDRNCPENLRDDAESGYADSARLIERWHNRQRLSYVVSPRFAPTSTARQLAFAGQLLEQYPTVYLQSHVAENEAEIKWVAELFPQARSYLDVYDGFGLLGPRSIYGHCIYLDETDRERMRESQTVAAFCPTSNLFLGSGLFDLARAKQEGVRTALATDVGGGTSFSMLRTADEAYKVAQLCAAPVTPVDLFYEMTLGGARALSMDHAVGNFEVGKEADFVVLDASNNSLLRRRLELADTIEEQLFALMLLGTEQSTRATYILGVNRYDRG